jgi:hypothetical protein
MDYALSTSAKFGTIGQSSLFFVLGRQPIRELANGAVMAAPPFLHGPFLPSVVLSEVAVCVR